jgi:CelD/BcsL family acetyltransferase involved in cellulose biosynthesis
VPFGRPAERPDDPVRMTGGSGGTDAYARVVVTATSAGAVPSSQRTPTVHVETGPSALELLDGGWDDLLAREPLPNPTLSSTWLRELARWQTGVPLVAVAESGGVLVAGAALELRGGGRLGPRVAAWLGPVEQHFSPDMLADPRYPGAAEAVVAAVLDVADVLSIGAPVSGPAARALAAVAPWHEAVVTGERWLLPWPAPRLAYAQKRAARELRHARGAGVEVEVRVAAEPDDVARALVRLFRIHRDRWRGRANETPRFATTRAHRLWNLHAVAALAVGGHVRIAEVTEDGRPIAASLGFVHGGGAVGHTQAIRPGGVLREPGHVAILACLEALAAAGATGFDLGVSSGEAGGPKTRLGSIADPIALLFAAASSRRQRTYEAARLLRDGLRRVGKTAAWPR